MKVWLDDVRDPPDAGWVWVRTAPTAIQALCTRAVNEISLDHDLGPAGSGCGNGYDVLLAMEEAASRGDFSFIPASIHIHTANPVAQKRMEAARASIRRICARGPRP